MARMSKVVSVNISETKGMPKKPVEAIELVPGLGVKGDAHAGPGRRQVSLLMIESIEKAKAMMESQGRAGRIELSPGVFAENITTQGVDLVSMSPGDELRVGPARLRLTRIGKECHTRCAIYYQAGDCIMPAEGVFFEVMEGGAVRPGDEIKAGEKK